MIKSISDCLPKHLAPRLGKQKKLDDTLMPCLPTAHQPFCSFTVKDGQVTLHTTMAPHLVVIRQYAPHLQLALKEAFPHLSRQPIRFRVSPRQDQL